MRASRHGSMARRRPPPLRPAIVTDPVASARAGHLRYVDDTGPGIRRTRVGRGFRYVDAGGRSIRDRDELARFRSLAVPPAWTDVWICPHANGHIQATGRDARGRKQYRYHPRWRVVRDETKYARMLAFADALPRMRARVERDLALPGLPREKVLATVVRLLETTFIRVGNEEYARENHSFGLTTLRTRHVHIAGATLEFQFRGKSGKQQLVRLTDRRLARIVRRCQELPGYELFQYVDADGTRRAVDSADVNAYLREISGEDFTAKDFRTWAGTVLAAVALAELERVDSDTAARSNVVRAIAATAKRLGNTPAVCRKCYVHPAVVEAYLDARTLESLRVQAEEKAADPHALRPDEAAVLELLRARLAREADAPARRAS